MLKCNISIDVNHLAEGIHLGLKDDREKTSQQLGRWAVPGAACWLLRSLLCLPIYIDFRGLSPLAQQRCLRAA